MIAIPRHGVSTVRTNSIRESDKSRASHVSARFLCGRRLCAPNLRVVREIGNFAFVRPRILELYTAALLFRSAGGTRWKIV